MDSSVTGLASLPQIMGVLNVTPDSFSDGGRFVDQESIKKQIELMVSEGVDIIDIGGESTRPGAFSVNLEEELDRVLPVIEWVKQESDVQVSIDTYKPQVMVEAIRLGVDMVNDVNALQSEGAVEAVANSNVKVCLMHKQGQPDSMQEKPSYQNVVQEVVSFLQERSVVCERAGIEKERIILDPGFGFGKSLAHNVALFEQLDDIIGLGFPVLVGVSRKTMIGQLLNDLPVEQRMVGSVSAAVVAALKGSRILRVHDVKETKQAIQVAMSLV